MTPKFLAQVTRRWSCHLLKGVKDRSGFGEGAFQGPNYPESDMQREQHFTSRIFRRTWLSH